MTTNNIISPPELTVSESTPALLATAGPSPAVSVILESPGLEAADKAFDLGAPAQQDWTMPSCWGHRGASASFPENTRMSFIEAVKAGADGIETDIHITADGVLVMFHDPQLDRTTDGEGRIHDLPWHGVLEHVRTKKAPHQHIPRFTEVLEILMQPDNKHVKLNIDCKVENNPVQLFGLIKSEIEKYQDWQTLLAPRCILGLWHPKFLDPAVEILPCLPRFCISMSIPQVRKYFFERCDGFSVWYRPLASAEGARFREECARAGKKICTWTVNSREEMKECARWGIYSVISDKPDLWREVKKEIETDRIRALKPTLQSYILPYLSLKNYWFEHQREAREEFEYLEREGGAFDSMRAVRPSDVM